jgi:xanthine dehydrogenase molybdopterin-binding subunit B
MPKGQGHRTVLAQVVADVFGIPLDQVRVTTDLDTAKGPRVLGGVEIRGHPDLIERDAEDVGHDLGENGAMASPRC